MSGWSINGAEFPACAYMVYSCSNKLEADRTWSRTSKKKKNPPDVRECVRKDAEGRSGVVPLMVGARELKCIPLTEQGATKLLQSSAFAEKRKRTDELVPGGQ